MAVLGWSDMASGILIVLVAALCCRDDSPGRSGRMPSSVSGLLFARLIFWSPSAAVDNNHMIVGALVIAFAILVRMMPGMSHESMMDESDLPVGWSYSPSTYEQRLPIIAQDSSVCSSRASSRPTSSDISTVSGDRSSLVSVAATTAAFGIVVVPLGVVSIYFIITQPIMIGTWCMLCLAAALAMLIMIPFTLDELVAMGQYLIQSRRRGESLVRIFSWVVRPRQRQGHAPGVRRGAQ